MHITLALARKTEENGNLDSEKNDTKGESEEQKDGTNFLDRMLRYRLQHKRWATLDGCEGEQKWKNAVMRKNA